MGARRYDRQRGENNHCKLKQMRRSVRKRCVFAAIQRGGIATFFLLFDFAFQAK
jgi:hypothetical protein